MSWVKAIQINGRGSGAAYGNKVHATFSKLANNLSVDGYTIRTEVSYLNGKIVPMEQRGLQELTRRYMTHMDN